jgi:hypothetical protein
MCDVISIAKSYHVGRAIAKTYFIGSPMAMTTLLARAHSCEAKRALHTELVDHIFDFKESLEPYIEEIKYHSIPLCYKFSYLQSRRKAITQYKLFSPEDEGYYWLPSLPDIEAQESAPLCNELVVPECPSVGGWRSFLNSEQGDARTVCLRLHEEFEQMEIEESSRVSGIPVGEFERDPSSVCRERQGLIIMLKEPVQTLIGIPQVMGQVSNESAIKEVSKVANQVLHAVSGGRIKVGGPDAKFSFKAFVLTPAELHYWNERASPEELRRFLRERVEDASQEWTPMLPITEEALARISDEAVRYRVRVEAEARRTE